MTKKLDKAQSELLKRYAEKFDALSDPLRLRIVLILRDGEKCVCEICESLGMKQSKISYHLKILLKASLIKSRTDKTWSYYSLKKDVINWINEECCDFIQLKIK